MKRLATIAQDDSDYAPRLRSLLDATGIDPHEFIGLDYFGLVPFFVIAGASVRPDAHAHGNDVNVVAIHVEVEDDLEEAFYATLPELLEDAYGGTADDGA
jgi:hypothetical protein